MNLDKLIFGLLLLVLALALVPEAKAEGEHWLGVNTVSRHFTADHERYCEKNPGVFYEHHWRPGRGVQVGYYRNSWCKLETEDRIDDTFYAVYLYQPWAFGARDQLRLGGFAGAASGYKKGNLVPIVGAVVTWRWGRGAAVQSIVNPAVAGLQIKAKIR